MPRERKINTRGPRHSVGANRITARNVVWECPWLRVIRKRVRAHDANRSEDFYSVLQPDYVNVFAITVDGLTPIVRQFRPAIEGYTWELPAGLRNVGETPRAAASRELREEVGLRVLEIVALGKSFVDTGRLSNYFYSFAAVAEPIGGWSPEPDVEARLVPIARLRQMILRGRLSLQTHVGLVLSAMTQPAAVRMLSRHGLSHVRGLVLD